MFVSHHVAYNHLNYSKRGSKPLASRDIGTYMQELALMRARAPHTHTLKKILFKSEVRLSPRPLCLGSLPLPPFLVNSSVGLVVCPW